MFYFNDGDNHIDEISESEVSCESNAPDLCSDDQSKAVEAEKQETETEVVEPATSAPINTDIREESAQDQLMRVQADFANFKRRTEKDRELWTRIAQTKIIEGFLPLIDDIERAHQAAQSAPEGDAVAEGVKLMHSNSAKMLEKIGIELVDTSGSFDPELHEALLKTSSDNHESGAIVQVLAPGYSYKGSVIRHAKVSVAE